MHFFPLWLLITLPVVLAQLELISSGKNGRSFLSQLKGQLSSEAKILSDSKSPEFQKRLERWTDTGKQTPGAIVVITNERDITSTVLLAIKYNVPFVPATHGHSPFSTIGRDGIIIDTIEYAKISVNKKSQTVTITPGVVNHELIATLADNDLVTSLGESDLGSFSNLLGGGLSGTSGIFGAGSDQIISARILTGTGKVLTVSSRENSDLFYGLRGAGTYFGFVLELTVQAYSTKLLERTSTGNETGTVWSGTAIFPGSRIAEVTKALVPFVNAQNVPVSFSGSCILTNIPEMGIVFLVGLTWFGSSAEAEAFFAAIPLLKPLVWEGVRVPFKNMTDIGNPAYDSRGGFKHFQLAGVPRFEADQKGWEGVFQSYTELLKKAPDAAATGWGFEWVVDKLIKPAPDTAWSHREVKAWMEALTWYTNPKSRMTADRLENAAIGGLIRKFRPEEIHRYQNFDRSSPIGNRYMGAKRINKLRALKKKYDPKGLFTKIFL